MRSSTKLAMMATFAMHVAWASDPHPMVDTQTPKTTLMKDYVPPTDLDNVPDYYYPTDYRILNCWECFEAQGKVCIDKTQSSLYQHTGSSDPGNVFCCKPGAQAQYCTHEAVHANKGAQYQIETICSPPSQGASTKWQDVLTGDRNHQMWSYCPAISQDICGIQDPTSSQGHHMALKAGLAKKHVESNKMKYLRKNANGTPLERKEREYDACYYEIVLDQDVLTTHIPKKLHLQVSKKSEMNVYIYAGSSNYLFNNQRIDATESVVANNDQAAVGQTYSVLENKALLIVAYPNEGVDTDFGFNYWLEAELKPPPAPVNPTPVTPVTPTPTPVVTPTPTPTPNPTPTTSTQTTTSASASVNTPVAQLEPSAVLQTDISTGTQPTNTNTVQQQQQSQTTVPAKTAQEEQDDMIFYALCGGAGILFIAIVVLCYKCRNKGKIQHTNHEDPGFPSGGNHTNENERSMQLEDLEDEQSNRPSMSGKGANMFENDSEKQRRTSYKKVNAGSVKEAD